jgi:hypothetical protein
MNIKMASACSIGVLYLFSGILPAKAADRFSEGFANLGKDTHNT